MSTLLLLPPSRLCSLRGLPLSARYGLIRRLITPCVTSEDPYVSHPVTEAQQVPVPLCKRAANHVEQLSALLHWRQEVLSHIQKVKDAFETADGGPSASELQREVTWVLDDVTAAWREQEQQQWLPCSWQQLDLELQAAARRRKNTADWEVQLRAPVQQLEHLWRVRLQARVPFQYLIHTAHWRDLVLSVGPGILIPRPETEIMVDLAANATAANPGLAAAPWADLGTGSGAIAIGIARLLQAHHRNLQQQLNQQRLAQGQQQPSVHVWAVDLSPTAVAYATANAAACGVQDSVSVAQGSWFEPLQQQQLQGKLGGILSNPPYIPRVQMDGLQAEVGRHEPWSALDGGPQEGIDSIQVICDGAAAMLIPGGFLALETAGQEQAYLVKGLLQQQLADGKEAFDGVQVHDDCYGVPRFVSAIRSWK